MVRPQPFVPQATKFYLCHYDEIGLKGDNRNYFERILIRNIKLNKKISVKKNYGSLEIENKKGISEILSHTFGVANYALAYKIKPDLKIITDLCLQEIKKKKYKSFRISAKRSDKTYPINSQQLNERIGETVQKKIKMKVDLENPEINCFVEIVKNIAYVYFKKEKGLGGLPVGSSGKAICLLSGGIDSPVAAYYAAKRGLSVSYLHFHSYPHTSKASIDKVKELIKILKPYTLSEKLHLYPFIDWQRKIYKSAPEKYRIILYRRLMFKIAEQLAVKEKAQAIITGEALGQVASQTIQNIDVVNRAVKLPVLRPLIGFDKKEIIAKAREICTYATSILPHGDCCTVFMPKNPETKANLSEVESLENRLCIILR
ncbi:MAG: tRNA uracil 4-sulfurtransferase ThiI [Patescibacteria group bacterium]|jgi:thiamine biosynthesis protein ThiI